MDYPDPVELRIENSDTDVIMQCHIITGHQTLLR